MIRPGKIEDLPAIRSFEFFGGTREKEIQKELLYVFEDPDEGPIAYISIADYKFHKFPYITYLLVRSDFLRRGIGTQLLHHIEQIHAGQRIFISVEADNDPMLTLIKKEDYHLSGALKGLNDHHSGVVEVFFFKDVVRLT